ncbi:MAG: hypothetical protein AB1486_31145 [Planctomycetota bacterium]
MGRMQDRPNANGAAPLDSTACRPPSQLTIHVTIEGPAQRRLLRADGGARANASAAAGAPSAPADRLSGIGAGAPVASLSSRALRLSGTLLSRAGRCTIRGLQCLRSGGFALARGIRLRIRGATPSREGLQRAAGVAKRVLFPWFYLERSPQHRDPATLDAHEASDQRDARTPDARPAAEAEASGRDEPASPFVQHCRQKLDLLAQLLRTHQGLLVPELDPLAPQGHTIELADRVLSVERGRSLEALEELADLGLLRREPHNVIHVCPECRRSQINFRELCAYCYSFDLELESLIHHFRCAHSGVESDFTSGFELVCPKCHQLLHQLGQDFDRPGKVYVCRTCQRVSETPVLRVQCLHCHKEFESTEVEPFRIYRYRPTFLAVRAVELGRLSCLDVSTVMFDSRIGLATREFLNLQARRELARLARHGVPFATAVLAFRHHGVTYPVFREWKPLELRQLGRAISESVRSLDLVAQLDSARLGLLFPETDERGVAGVRERLTSRLSEYVLRSRSSQTLQVIWGDTVWSDPKTPLDEVLCFFDREIGGELEPHPQEEQPGALTRESNLPDLPELEPDEQPVSAGERQGSTSREDEDVPLEEVAPDDVTAGDDLPFLDASDLVEGEDAAESGPESEAPSGDETVSEPPVGAFKPPDDEVFFGNLVDQIKDLLGSLEEYEPVKRAQGRV